ncbi:hypothetical protein [Neptunomonas phycophila]|uniref:hypothetical protein n=1 Tax=Neptunomonas phycophila TaxID=1572645 RepID=UPI000948E332|nr:hypothetical protein [Neptunomonas phycophila]
MSSQLQYIQALLSESAHEMAEVVGLLASQQLGARCAKSAWYRWLLFSGIKKAANAAGKSRLLWLNRSRER